MNKFCEECGAPLEAGLKFCESCGAPVPQEEDAKVVSDFSISDAGRQWQEFADSSDAENGILLTDINALLNCISNASRQDIAEVLDNYVAACKTRGVNYLAIDKSFSSVEQCVAFISDLHGCAKIDNLFIVGNEKVIPVQVWKNECGDSDANVEADLPYSTLNCDSPWSGVDYGHFENTINVGRLPVWQDETLREFKFYFENAARHSKISSYKTYALSALQWEDTSKRVYSKFKNGSELKLSPDVTKYNVSETISNDANIFMFNLHGGGSDSQCEWYGQDGSDYPEAFSPDNACKIYTPFIICVEACYGAKYIGLGKRQSIVLSAMTNGCLGLLGSSKIAYGTPSGDGCCADIIVGAFYNSLLKGGSLGESCQKARQMLIPGKMGDEDDSTIKTLAEFSLYGDPSLRPFGTAKAKPKIFSKIANRSIRVELPDVRHAVALEIASVNEKIMQSVNEQVYKSVKQMDGLTPKVFKMKNKNMYQALYSKSENNFTTFAKAYFDDSGRVKKLYLSK